MGGSDKGQFPPYDPRMYESASSSSLDKDGFPPYDPRMYEDAPLSSKDQRESPPYDPHMFKSAPSSSSNEKGGFPPYDPRMYEDSRSMPPPGSTPNGGQNGTIVLYDLENGHEVGALGDHINVSGVVPGSHDPVEIDLSGPDGVVTIRPAEYLRDASHPAYAGSKIVGTAATATRAIVTGASILSKTIETGARVFTEKTRPVVTPMTFQPSTHDRVRTIHNYTATGAEISAKTVGKVQVIAQNVGAHLAGKGDGHVRTSKPGLLNKTLIAIGTIGDGIEHASKMILRASSQAAAQVAEHRYGPEAGDLARGLTGAVKNVGLVYIDASGVSRRALVKSVAKGMVVGKVRGGGEVVFQGDDTSQGEFISGSPAPLPGYVAPLAGTLFAGPLPGSGAAQAYPPSLQSAPPAYDGGSNSGQQRLPSYK